MLWFITALLLCLVAYLVGRGDRLTRRNRAALIAQADPEHAPEALIDTTTGEVIDPGTRRYNRAVAKGKVIFE